MTEPSASRSAPRIVAWGIALLAAPAAVGLLRISAPTTLTAAEWLTPAVGGLLALPAAAAAARWLTSALRSGEIRAALVALAAAIVAASAAVPAPTAADPPPLPLMLGLAAASLALVAAVVIGRGVRGSGLVLASGVLVGVVLTLAGALFVTWPPVSGIAFGGGAAALFLAAAVICWWRPAMPALPLVLLASGAAALAVARVGTAEGVVALIPVVGSMLLLAVDDPAPRAAGAAAAVATARDGLPAMTRNLAEGILLLDREERIVDWNLAAGTLLELGADPRGQPAAQVLAPLIGDAGWTLLTTRAGDAQRRLLTERGRPLELTVVDEADDGTVVLVRDLALERGEATEAARIARELRGTIEELLDARRTIDLQRAEIERASQLDPLTGVANRRALLERLRTEVAQGRRYSHPVVVVIIDIDEFGVLNRQHGLLVGDAVLRELALRLRLRLREADALGRLAGDAFAVVLPHTDERGAAVFADAVLRRMVRRPIQTTAGPLTVAISLGVALMRPGMEIDVDGLLAAADEALASARRGGGNRIAFDRRHGLVRLDEARPAGWANASVEDETAQDSGA